MSDNVYQRFAHQRLDVYRVAILLFAEVEDLAAAFPKGYADLKDQMRRSAAATVRHIAEGANRVQPRDKAARFMIARGEVGECDAALEMAGVVGLVAPDRLFKVRKLANRVAAMLWGLLRATPLRG